MGKNTRRQIQHKDDFHNVEIGCDSVEECDFIDWCSEAAQLKIIDDFEYQPQSIKLFEAANYIDWKGKSRSLLREHVYSPDFKITFNPKSYQTLVKEFKLPHKALQESTFQVYLDVKGEFQRGDGGRSFSINQKWVYQKTGIYVQKIVPKDFFKTCGCPQSCFKTRKTGKTRKAFAECKSISEVFGI